MEAAAVGAGEASRDDRPEIARQQAPVAYMVVVRKGPTWRPADFEPLCRLLSRRFAGEIWAFGSYDADVRVGIASACASSTKSGRRAASGDCS